jgi:glycosyltransferase involved in cell wall biosynthesis
MDYILLTLARNEERFLPLAAEALLNQRKKPLLWMVVDDGSQDSTFEIIRRLEVELPWIVSRRLPPSDGGLGTHYAQIANYGFRELIHQSRCLKNSPSLLGKIDADVTFDRSCFEMLVEEFVRDPLLGMASPRLVQLGGCNDIPEDRSLSDHPTDGIRLYRWQCYEDIGGLSLFRAAETVAEAKARLRGWRIHRFDHIVAKHHRTAHSLHTPWQRLVMHGSEAYFLGYHPALAFARLVFDLIYGRPRYRFLAYGWGYLHGFLAQEPRIADPEILHYFAGQRPKEIFSGIVKRRLIRFQTGNRVAN